MKTALIACLLVFVILISGGSAMDYKNGKAKSAGGWFYVAVLLAFSILAVVNCAP